LGHPPNAATIPWKILKNLNAMLKGPIELDAMLVRFVEAVCLNLIRPRTFDEIAACMVEPGEDEIVAVNLSDS
jgi:hypothetical protein